MKKIVPVLGMILSLGLVGCQSMSLSSGATAKSDYVYDLNRQCPTVLDMKVGQTLQFKVDENITTGYAWQLLHPLKNIKVEESYIIQKHEPMLVGAGGEKVYRFTATQQGEDFIQLIHVRGWENVQDPTVHWQCKIRISS